MAGNRRRRRPSTPEPILQLRATACPMCAEPCCHQPAQQSEPPEPATSKHALTAAPTEDNASLRFGQSTVPRGSPPGSRLSSIRPFREVRHPRRPARREHHRAAARRPRKDRNASPWAVTTGHPLHPGPQTRQALGRCRAGRMGHVGPGFKKVSSAAGLNDRLSGAQPARTLAFSAANSSSVRKPCSFNAANRSSAATVSSIDGGAAAGGGGAGAAAGGGC